jgi:NitT/TauT family transport system ATP-binding protein
MSLYNSQDNQLIDIREVGKTFQSRDGAVEALAPLNFYISEKEFFSVVGPSGCGKSTLLNLLSGLLLPSTGEIIFRGKKLSGPRKDMGIVFQSPVLLPWRNVERNILLPIEIMHQDLKSGLERVNELLEITGLSDFRYNYPHELSGGMQQRVSIARGLIHQPSLLLMDEPFSALDFITREAMNLELLKIWAYYKQTVFFITHNIAEAVFLSDRVLVMSSRPGRILNIMNVNIERPRTLEMMDSHEFVRCMSVIRQVLQKEAS